MGIGPELLSVVIAQRTNEVLQAMTSWFQIIHVPESDTWQKIQSELFDLAKAILFSVETARQGLTLGAKAMTMAGGIKKANKKQRTQILDEIKAFTLMGATNATGAWNKFGFVGANILALLERISAEELRFEWKHDGDVCKLFLSDLHKLRKIAEKLWFWWGGVEHAMPGSPEFRRDSDVAVVKKQWKDLEVLYEAYVSSFNVVIAQNPELFAQAQSKKPDSPSPDIQHPTRMTDEVDDSASLTTAYSCAHSSAVTEYGLFYTRHAFNSSHSLHSRIDDSDTFQH